MKVALISDVHANLPALEAVLAHARQQGAESIWNAGDLVAYGPFPDEVVKQIRQEGAHSTLGRYDQRVLRYKKKRAGWRKSKRLEEYLAIKWAYGQLSKKSRKYLRFLSRELRIKARGKRFLLTHANPGSGKRSLTVATPEKRLRQIAREAKADVIVCGHSHQPFVKQVDSVWFINPGSVGLPRDGDPRASYTLLQLLQDEIAVQHFRIEYDVEQTATACREHKLPESFAQMFLRGQSLSAALEDRDG
jgi:putative phosphoesterase